MRRLLIVLALLGTSIGGCSRAHTFSPYALGCVKSTSAELALAERAVAVRSDAPLPSSVDLRAYYGPVTDQGSQSSCVAHAAAAELGRQYDADLAIGPIYNRRSGSCENDSGMSLAAAATILAKYGDCLSDYMPYDPSDSCALPSADAQVDALLRLAAMQVVWTQAGAAPLETIQRYLAAGQGVLVGAPVYSSFYRGGIIPRHGAKETFFGGHAIALVGYDDVKQAFIFRNSWGDDWGDGGYGMLSYDFVRYDAWEGWVMTRLLAASRYRAYVHGECRDKGTGAMLSGVTVKYGAGSSTTNASGYWGFSTVLTAKQTVQLEVTPPQGYALTTPASFKAPNAISDVIVPALYFAWQTTPTPKPTVTPTATLEPEPPTPPATTPTVPRPPTLTPTTEYPPGTPTATPEGGLWALLSPFGTWKLIGDNPTARNYLYVPEEHFDLIRRQTYLALGTPLPQYDTWKISRFYAALNLTGADVFTGQVVVVDEQGQELYYAVRTSAGILIMAAQP